MSTPTRKQKQMILIKKIRELKIQQHRQHQRKWAVLWMMTLLTI
ncbi:MAG: hypothetical protein ABJB16_05445 [Saprospiraceae bacterium]